MTTIIADWQSSFSNTSINATSVSNGGAQTTAAIDCDGHSTVEISITCVYGSPCNNGLKAFILRQVDDTPNYESQNDYPQGVELAYALSGTRRKTFTVDCRMLSKFKIEVQNDSGATVAVTVRYKFMDETSV